LGLLLLVLSLALAIGKLIDPIGGLTTPLHRIHEVLPDPVHVLVDSPAEELSKELFAPSTINGSLSRALSLTLRSPVSHLGVLRLIGWLFALGSHWDGVDGDLRSAFASIVEVEDDVDVDVYPVAIGRWWAWDRSSTWGSLSVGRCRVGLLRRSGVGSLRRRSVSLLIRCALLLRHPSSSSLEDLPPWQRSHRHSNAHSAHSRDRPAEEETWAGCARAWWTAGPRVGDLDWGRSGLVGSGSRIGVERCDGRGWRRWRWRKVS
jgi:hypothetical protein